MTEPELDLRAELARIDRDRAETLKLMAERQKLLAEAERLSNCRFDLNRYEPWQIVTTAFTIGISIVAIAISVGVIVAHLMPR